MPNRPKVALIAAVSPEGLIGSGNQLPWKMPRDLRFFKKATHGHPIIMGRKTFESIGRKPLPQRECIVVSRDPSYTAPGCKLATSLIAALRLPKRARRIFVIGGGQLYTQALPLADEIILTRIESHNPTGNLFPPFSGDTYFPAFHGADWMPAHEGRLYVASSRLTPPPLAKRNHMYFRVVKFTRVGGWADLTPLWGSEEQEAVQPRLFQD